MHFSLVGTSSQYLVLVEIWLLYSQALMNSHFQFLFIWNVPRWKKYIIDFEDYVKKYRLFSETN